MRLDPFAGFLLELMCGRNGVLGNTYGRRRKMNEIATMDKALFDSTGGRNPPNVVEFWAMTGSPVPPGATEAIT